MDIFIFRKIGTQVSKKIFASARFSQRRQAEKLVNRNMFLLGRKCRKNQGIFYILKIRQRVCRNLHTGELYRKWKILKLFLLERHSRKNIDFILFKLGTRVFKTLENGAFSETPNHIKMVNPIYAPGGETNYRKLQTFLRKSITMLPKIIQHCSSQNGSRQTNC